MNIVFIGMRATGKTTVAKIVAEKLNRDFIDMDDLVAEKSGFSIFETVEKFGWEHFRNLESKVTEEIARCSDKIISTGGGIVIREENMNSLKKNGFLILLTAHIDTMLFRISKDITRPSLTKETSERGEIAEVLKQRKMLYEKNCDAIVTTDTKNKEEVAQEILAIIKEKDLCN